MSRATFALLVVLVLALGFAVGWWYAGRVAPPALSPVRFSQRSSGEPPVEQKPRKPKVTAGFCCITPGQACEQVQNASTCFQRSGKGFQSRQASCDHFCVTIGSIKQ